MEKIDWKSRSPRCLLCKLERIVDGARRNPSRSELGKGYGLLSNIRRWEGVKDWCPFHRLFHKSQSLILEHWLIRLDDQPLGQHQQPATKPKTKAKAA